jgi:hypothetical protein
MRVDQEINILKSNLLSADNWDERKSSSDRLFDIGGQENIDYLIGLLEHENSLVRNAVSITFMDNKFNQALEPLLASINKPEHKNARGTMVYALQALDCSQKLKELFDILFNSGDNWEVQSGILTVLDEQEFEFYKSDLLDIKEKWEEIKDKWNEVNKINLDKFEGYEIDKNLIQNFVDGYVSYLDNK